MSSIDEKMPLVSVVIPTRNRSHWLKDALESVFQQTYHATDIIVVDDASTDNTRGILSNLGKMHANLRVIYNEVAQGPCPSRNKGIQAAQGEFITFLDDDDEWVPERLQILVNNHDTQYAYICSDYWIRNSRGLTLQRLPRIITYQDMLYRNRTGNTVLARTKHVQDIGGFDESLPGREDYDLWLRLIESTSNHKAKVINQPLHIINKTNSERLSQSNKPYHRKKMFLLKHHKKMNSWQRRFQRVNLRKLLNTNLNWKDRVCNWIVRKKLKYF